MARRYLEPEYRRRIRQEVENKNKGAEAEKWHRENRDDANRISREISEIRAQQQSSEATENRRWRCERLLHFGEIGALVLAAAVGATAIVVSSSDSGAIKVVMQDQSQQMKTNSALQKIATEPRMVANPNVLMNKENAAIITFQWLNIGPGDAIHVSGWSASHVFASLDQILKFDFTTKLTSYAKVVVDDGTYIQNEGVSPESFMLNPSDVAGYIAGQDYPVSWGYLEYRDRLDTFYTLRYCFIDTFASDGAGGITGTLPHIISNVCNSRTLTEPPARH